MDASFAYDPLDYYKEYLKPTHEKNVSDYFDELTRLSGVDVLENRKTVREYRDKEKQIEKLKNRLFWLKFLRVSLFVLSGILILLSLLEVISFYISLPVSILAVLSVFVWLNKKIGGFDKTLENENAALNALYQKALLEMAPLNNLFSESATLSLFEKTNPHFKFSKNFSYKTARDLRENYDMPEYDDDNVSVLDTLSGYYNDNPFVYLRRLIHTLGEGVYYGYRTISWTEYYRDANGKTRTRVRTQTLRASVVKPKPYYHVDTCLHFGAQAAPDLSFSREGKNINRKSDGAIERMVKSGEKKLKRRSEKAIGRGDSFVGMTNTEFDVLFGATDRDHEVQFRLMFTPLAQTSIVELVLSDDTYGDDFNFYKRRRDNVIRTHHAQNWSMETLPERYKSFSYDEAREKFLSFNNEYFKSVYFDFAPLLAVPAYHEDVRVEKKEIEKGKQAYADEEYEAIANALGASGFAHLLNNSNIILKAKYLSKNGDEEKISVTAHSYATRNCVDTVMVLGGDGRLHAVAVPWVEYIPVSNESLMFTKIEPKKNVEKGAKSQTVKDKILAYVKAD